MKTRPLIVALIAFVALGAYLYFYEIPRAEKAAQEEQGASKLLRIDWDAVDLLVIERFKERIALVKKDGDWRIAEPVDDLADGFAVDTILTDLKQLTVKRRLSGVENRAGDFDLVNPDIRLTIGTPDYKRVLVLGGENRLDSSRYAVLDNSTDVLVVPETIFRAVTKDLTFMRNKRVFAAVGPEQVASVEVDRDGKLYVRLVRENGDWRIDGPMRAPADSDAVGRLVNSLLFLNIKVFYDEHPGSLRSYGLDDPSGTISIRTVAGETMGLMLGKEKDGGEFLFAKRVGRDPVVLVPIDTLARATPPLDSLCDKRVFAVDPAAVSRYEIKYLQDPADSAILVRLDGRWSTPGGKPGAIEPTMVEGVLGSLAELRALAFIQTAGDSDEQTAPAIEVALTTDGAVDAHRWLVSAASGNGRRRVTRLPDGPVVEVDAASLDAVLEKASVLAGKSGAAAGSEERAGGDPDRPANEE